MHPALAVSPIPLNVQLADLFRQRIARGEWPVGYRLPSLEELMKEFGVARLTMRQAIERLAREGLVLPQQGRGTVVIGKPRTEPWLSVQTSLDELDEVYLSTKPGIQHLHESIAAPALTKEDGKPAAKYRYIRRLHTRSGVPYCLISIYLDDQIFSRSPERFRSRVVIGLLRSMKGIVIAKARQRLTIGAADIEVASHLKIPVNAPIAMVRRVFNDPDGYVIYVGELTYRGDFVRLEMDVRV